MTLRRFGPLVALVCCLLGVSSLPSRAAHEKLLLVVLDKVTWHDLLSEDVSLPVLRNLMEEGAVGMMCVRTARGYGGEYLTIGAGSRASSRRDPVTGADAEANAYQVTEILDGSTAARAFVTRTGQRPPTGGVVHLSIGELLRQNASAEHPLSLGLLGGALGRSGLQVACVGNADTLDSPHRELVAIGMDERGVVPGGDVSGRLVTRDRSLPYGLTFDPDVLLSAVQRAAASADLIVLDPGETSRVELCADYVTLNQLDALRRRAIEKTDRFLGEAISSLPNEAWSVLVVTPGMPEAGPGESDIGLAPVIWSSGWSGAGMLTSPSTGRPGIVLNTDIAPTVLAFFGVDAPREAVGRAMSVEPTEGDGIARLRSDLVRHGAVEAARHRLFRAIPILSAIALFVAAFCLLVGERVPTIARMSLRGALLVLVSAPAAMLLAALRPLPADEMLLAVGAVSVALAVAASWITGWRSGHVLPCLVVVALLAYDLVRGQQMLYWSPFSYSPIAGARFYGIGNEYAGVLLGAGLIGGASLLWPRERSGRGERIAVAVTLLLLAILVGVPRFGANLGMSLALAVGASVFIVYLWRGGVGWAEALGALLAVTVLIGSAVVIDLVYLGPEASHIGRWASAVRAEGWAAIAEVLSRKMSMNLLLLKVSSWTDAAAGALAVLAVAVAARPARVVAVLKERAWLSPALIACVAGATAAFALNDSGIVAASLTLLYAAASLSYVSLGDVGLEEHR